MTGSRPVSARISAIWSTRSGCVNWRAERLTDITSGSPLGASVAPRRRLPAGGLEHPAAERRDQAGLLGQADERERRDQPALGVLPADQRLEARRSGRSGGPRSAGSGRAARRARGRGGGRSRGRAARASARSSTGRTARSARPDRPWPGPSRPRPRAAARPGVTRPGSPRAMPIEALMNHSRPLSGERRAQLGRDRLRDPPRLALVRDGVEDDPELVAAEPGDGVAGAQARREPLPDRDQQPVADGVADALVDDLEAVEVEHDHGDRAGLVRADAREGMGDAVRQQLAVRQAGRRVVEGAALGDVDEARVVDGDRGQLGEPGQGRRRRAGRTCGRPRSTPGR